MGQSQAAGFRHMGDAAQTRRGFDIHPTRLKVTSGQANLFPDSTQAPESQNKINSCFTKCHLNTYYDSQ